MSQSRFQFFFTLRSLSTTMTTRWHPGHQHRRRGWLQCFDRHILQYVHVIPVDADMFPSFGILVCRGFAPNRWAWSTFWPYCSQFQPFSIFFSIAVHVRAHSRRIRMVSSAIRLAFAPYICANRWVLLFLLIWGYADIYCCFCSRVRVDLNAMRVRAYCQCIRDDFECLWLLCAWSCPFTRWILGFPVVLRLSDGFFKYPRVDSNTLRVSTRVRRIWMDL